MKTQASAAVQGLAASYGKALAAGWLHVYWGLRFAESEHLPRSRFGSVKHEIARQCLELH